MEMVRERARSVVTDALEALRSAAKPGPARQRLEDLAEYILQREL